MIIRDIAMRVLGFLFFPPLPAYAFLQIPGMSRITQIEVPASVQGALRTDTPRKRAYDFRPMHTSSLFLATRAKPSPPEAVKQNSDQKACPCDNGQAFTQENAPYWEILRIQTAKSESTAYGIPGQNKDFHGILRD